MKVLKKNSAAAQELMNTVNRRVLMDAIGSTYGAAYLKARKAGFKNPTEYREHIAKKAEEIAKNLKK